MRRVFKRGALGIVGFLIRFSKSAIKEAKIISVWKCFPIISCSSVGAALAALMQSLKLVSVDFFVSTLNCSSATWNYPHCIGELSLYKESVSYGASVLVKYVALNKR